MLLAFFGRVFWVRPKKHKYCKWVAVNLLRNGFIGSYLMSQWSIWPGEKKNIGRLKIILAGENKIWLSEKKKISEPAKKDPDLVGRKEKHYYWEKEPFLKYLADIKTIIGFFPLLFFCFLLSHYFSPFSFSYRSVKSAQVKSLTRVTCHVTSA